MYLDLIYMDGSHLWGQHAPFDTGTHDWQKRQVVVFPEKPVRQVSMHLLLRGHSGKAWFQKPELRQLRTPPGAARFDGVPVTVQEEVPDGFQLRDVAADSDYVQLQESVLGVKLKCDETGGDRGTFFDVTLSDMTGKDRAVTLLYAVRVPPQGLQWLEDPRRSEAVLPGNEYVNATRFMRVGSNGRLSQLPIWSRDERSAGRGVGNRHAAASLLSCLLQRLDQ